MFRSRLPLPQRWVPRALAAWLCVLLVSGVAPWLQARTAALPAVWVQAAALCTAYVASGEVPAPEGDAAALAAHGAHAAASQGTAAPWQSESEDDAATHAQHGLDCPLCLPALASPWRSAAQGPLGGHRAVARPWTLPAVAVPTAGAPLPARGPPALSLA